MSKYAVTVEVLKLVGKATRTIRVDAETQAIALKLAKAIAQQGPKVIKAVATAAKLVK